MMGKNENTLGQWQGLTRAEKDRVHKLAEAEHKSFLKRRGYLPGKKAKAALVQKVCEKVQADGIFTDDDECKRRVFKIFTKLNHDTKLAGSGRAAEERPDAAVEGRF
jgi:hypothetical protein